MQNLISYMLFQAADMYKNEEIEYQLADKQECFVWNHQDYSAVQSNQAVPWKFISKQCGGENRTLFYIFTCNEHFSEISFQMILFLYEWRFESKSISCLIYKIVQSLKNVKRCPDFISTYV